MMIKKLSWTLMLTMVTGVFSSVSATAKAESNLRPWLPPPYTCHYEGIMLVCKYTG